MNIKIERMKRNLTQEELAEILKVSAVTCGKYERDPATLPASKLLVLADLFGCSIDYLLDREGVAK